MSQSYSVKRIWKRRHLNTELGKGWHIKYILKLNIWMKIKLKIKISDTRSSHSRHKSIIIIIFFSTTHCSLKAYCAIWVRRSNFRHQASPCVSLRAKAPSGGRWNCGREMSGNFA